jgi:dolichyl-phosphate-mannose-protein mannosyltransferase
MWVLDRSMLHRGMDDFGPNLRRWWDRALGFLFIAWVLHYLPFFLMGRMLFLHHYLPAFILTVILTTTLIDFLGRQPAVPKMKANLPMAQWQSGQGSIVFHALVVLLIALNVGLYFYFMPLTYGTGFETLEKLRSRKWFKSWDLQHA